MVIGDCCNYLEFLFLLQQNKYKQMKKDSFLQLSNAHSAQYSNSQYSGMKGGYLNLQGGVKKVSLQMHNNPMGHHKPFLLSSAKNPENLISDKIKHPSNQSSTTSLSQGVRERVKSNSFAVEPNNAKIKARYDYLFYKQEQHKLQQAAQNEIKQRSNARAKVEGGCEQQNILLREQNRLLKSKIEKMQLQFLRKEQLLNSQKVQLNGMLRQIQELRTEMLRFEGMQREYKGLLSNYNFMVTKWNGYQQSQDYYAGIGEKYREMVQRCSKLQTILQQKDATLQSSIRNKNEEYNSVVQAKGQEIRSLEMRIGILEKENQRLKCVAQCGKLESVQDEESKGQGSFQNEKFMEAAAEFEKRIAAAYQQNHQLKNAINHLQGKIDELKVQKDSLQKTLSAFEQRDRSNKNSRANSELQILRDQLQNTKEEHDKAVSRYELQILKLQNVIQSKRFEINGSLLDFYDQERLHEGFMNALAEIERLKSRIQSKR